MSRLNSPKPLSDALRRLTTYIDLAETRGDTPDMREAFQTAAIQSFEFCYALALKAMERELQERLAPEVIEAFNFRSFMRAAWEAGLIENLEAWDKYRELRNITSHTYDNAKAARVYAALPEFVQVIQHLLMRMEERAHAAP